jgi:hypothetical protein
MIWDLLTGSGAIQWLVGALAAIGGVLAVWLTGKRSGRKLEQAKRTAESLKVERERVVLDAELDAETDLLKRARDSGVVVRKAKR